MFQKIKNPGPPGALFMTVYLYAKVSKPEVVQIYVLWLA